MTADAPRRPTNRQWWKIAQTALALLDVEPPETRADASALIDRLVATNAPTPTEVPF